MKWYDTVKDKCPLKFHNKGTHLYIIESENCCASP